MANIRCRGPWDVRVKAQPELTRSFKNQAEAAAYRTALETQGLSPRLTPSDGATWEARVRRKGYETYARTCPSKKIAVDWAASIEGQIVERRFLDYREADRNTLGDLVQKYRLLIPEAKRAEDRRWSRLGKMLRDPICAITMSRLLASDFAKYRDRRLKDEVPVPRGVTRPAEFQARTIKPTTVIKELDLFSTIIGLAMKEWNIHLPINPASGERVARPKKQEGHERERRFIENPADPSKNEETILLDACATINSPHIYYIAKFAVETAMRRGEMIKLTWDMVHLTDEYLALPKAITKNGKDRIVPLTEKAWEIIAMLVTAPSDGQVFAGATVNSVKSAFWRANRLAQLQDFRFHDLRHEAVSRLFDNTDLRDGDIGSMTGHTDKRMLDRYRHRRPKLVVANFRTSFNRKNSTD